MLARFVAASLVAFILAGYVLAGEYTGIITSFPSAGGSADFLVEFGRDSLRKHKIKVKKDAKVLDGDKKVSHEDFSKMVKKASTGSPVAGLKAKITTEGGGKSKDNEDEIITKIEIIKVKKDK